jgi:hypothetical protein
MAGRMRDPVTVYKRKYDGRVTRHLKGDLVDTTGDGWLVVFHDMVGHGNIWGGEYPSHGPWFVVAMLSEEMPLVVSFRFDAKRELYETYADAALPATRQGEEISFIDLEIDLVGHPDGTYFIKDVEDFEQHRVEYGYPDEVVAAAWQGIDFAETAWVARKFPFDGTAERLLERELDPERQP